MSFTADHVDAAPKVSQFGRLEVRVYPDRKAMGLAAGLAAAARLRAILLDKPEANIVFAAAPSQDEFLATLASASGIDWARVNAFHMDEYLGLPPLAPQGFASFLNKRLFERVRPGQVFYIDGATQDATAECARYTALLRMHPVDLVCAGIGENGHLAFNDPPFADFSDSELVRVVNLNEASRWQQVHDGCFAALDEVPLQAITLTIPALLQAQWLYCMVPGSRKALAVKQTLSGAIRQAVPASALRDHPRAVLYLDKDAADLL
jgi:glucosamine-6-phosphate deaminase